MIKRILLSLALVLSFSIIFTLDVSEASTINNTSTTNIEISPGSSEISPMFVNDFRTRKVNVSTTYEWSNYRRVSDNLNTYGSTGGSISANRSTTFGVEVSGTIAGLGISTSGSVSSQIGYTLNAGPNQAVYMGFRTRYEVERGTREVYDIVTGRVSSRNTYTVKRPMYGEYKLLSY